MIEPFFFACLQHQSSIFYVGGDVHATFSVVLSNTGGLAHKDDLLLICTGRPAPTYRTTGSNDDLMI